LFFRKARDDLAQIHTRQTLQQKPRKFCLNILGQDRRQRHAPRPKQPGKIKRSSHIRPCQWMADPHHDRHSVCEPDFEDMMPRSGFEAPNDYWRTADHARGNSSGKFCVRLCRCDFLLHSHT
jgi:hypothetical protein